MQWDGSETAGFSTASADRIYLPVDSSVSRPAVDLQERSKRSLLGFVRQLIELRRTQPALHVRASMQVLHASEKSPAVVYLRKRGKQTLLVALNPSSRSVRIRIPVAGQGEPLLESGKIEIARNASDLCLQMGGVSFGVYQLKG